MDKTIILIISFLNKKNKARYDRSGHAELEDSGLPTNILTMFSFQVLISTRFFFFKTKYKCRVCYSGTLNKHSGGERHVRISSVVSTPVAMKLR